MTSEIGMRGKLEECWEFPNESDLSLSPHLIIEVTNYQYALYDDLIFESVVPISKMTDADLSFNCFRNYALDSLPLPVTVQILNISQISPSQNPEYRLVLSDGNQSIAAFASNESCSALRNHPDSLCGSLISITKCRVVSNTTRSSNAPITKVLVLKSFSEVKRRSAPQYQVQCKNCAHLLYSQLDPIEEVLGISTVPLTNAVKLNSEVRFTQECSYSLVECLYCSWTVGKYCHAVNIPYRFALNRVVLDSVSIVYQIDYQQSPELVSIPKSAYALEATRDILIYQKLAHISDMFLSLDQKGIELECELQRIYLKLARLQAEQLSSLG